MRIAAAIIFLALFSPSTVLAQSVTEARFVLDLIRDWLPGRYDNHAQIFVESAFGAGDEGNHPWRHLTIEEIDSGVAGDAVFQVTTEDRDNPGTPAKSHLIAFSVDEQERAVRMEMYSIDGAPLGDGAVYWRQGPNNVYGSSAAGANVRRELKLTDGEFWDLQPERMDRVPMRFTKVRFYECFALVHDPDDDSYTLRNPFEMHDGGDSYSFETEEAKPRSIEILLRRSMWTSRSGNNFVPLLQLMVYENGDRENPLANAWSAAESGRVGFSARDMASARCKLAAD